MRVQTLSYPVTLFASVRRFPHTANIIFLFLLPAILFLDSAEVAERFPYGQWVANLATFAYFILTYRSASPRLKRLMIYGLLVAGAGEVSFSLILHMYEYRLKTIPLYVPPGHTILYARVYQFVREPSVVRWAAQIKIAMFGLATAFSVSWLIWKHDLYGFICFGAFLLLLGRARHSRLFFLTMYLLVAYLELWGTGLHCWFWHPVLLNRFQGLPSANPPSSISVFYMGFDMACLALYLLFNLKGRRRFATRRAYRRSLARR